MISVLSPFTISRPRYLRRSGWIAPLLSVAALLLLLWWGIQDISGGSFRTEIGFFTASLGSPLMLVFPLVPVCLGALGTCAALSHRFAAQLWPRMDMSRWLRAQLVHGIVVSGTAIFLLILTVYVLTVFLWPQFWGSHIEPDRFGINPQDALQEEQHSFAFSQLLAGGRWVMGVGFSLIVAVQAALYTALAQAIALITAKPLWGLAFPLALYCGETIVMALLGAPSFALMYLWNPSGLLQPPLWHEILVLGLLTLGTLGAWVLVFRRRHELPSLA